MALVRVWFLIGRWNAYGFRRVIMVWQFFVEGPAQLVRDNDETSC